MSVRNEFYLESEINEQQSLIQKLFDDPERMKRIGVQGLNMGKVSHIQIIACGSSFHAGLLGMKYLENASNVPVSVERGHEFLFTPKKSHTKTLYILISQSGETKDIIDCAKMLKQHKCQMISITNQKSSTLARLVPSFFDLNCGDERSVPASKTFTMTCLYLYIFSISLAQNRGQISSKEASNLISKVESLPRGINSLAGIEKKLVELAQGISGSRSILVLGSGNDFPIALEGALKLREVCELHVEGMATGEIKHGPIAMLDDGVSVLVLISDLVYFHRNKKLLELIQSTGANVTILSTIPEIVDSSFSTIKLPGSGKEFGPIVLNIGCQMLSFNLGKVLKKSIDEPRHLAKVIEI